MSIRDLIEGKREWRAHMARVKALPGDYQIVYKEIQKYLFKVCPVELSESTSLLTGIVDLFEEGAISQKDILEITGSDVAAFCDGLIGATRTYDDICMETIGKEVSKAVKKAVKKDLV